MKTWLVASFFAAAIITGGCSSNSYHSSQWDVSKDGERYLYAVDGWIWERGRTPEALPHKIIQGSSPCYGGSPGTFICTQNDRLVLVDPTAKQPSTITRPHEGELDMDPSINPNDGRVYFVRMTEKGPARPGGFDIYSCHIDGTNLIRHTEANFGELRLGTQAFWKNSMYFVLTPPDDTSGWDTGSRTRIVKMHLTAPYRLEYILPEEHNAWEVSVSRWTGDLVWVTTQKTPEEVHRMNGKTGRKSEARIENGNAEWPLFPAEGDNVTYLYHADGSVSAMSSDSQHAARHVFNLTR